MRWRECKKCGLPTMPDKKGKCHHCGGQVTNKNHAVIVHFEGATFRSKAEFARYQALCWKQTAGIISDLKYRPPKVYLAPRVGWDVDFHYYDKEKGAFWWEEFKGKQEADYIIKRDLWRYTGPGPLRVVLKDAKTGLFHIDDEIVPLGVEAFIRDLQKVRAA